MPSSSRNDFDTAAGDNPYCSPAAPPLYVRNRMGDTAATYMNRGVFTGIFLALLPACPMIAFLLGFDVLPRFVSNDMKKICIKHENIGAHATIAYLLIASPAGAAAGGLIGGYIGGRKEKEEEKNSQYLPGDADDPDPPHL